MSSLNILCATCSEYFENSNVIYSTHCGHMFHKSCLLKWLKSSGRCPRCRSHCLLHMCHQLYISYEESTPEDNAMSIEYPKSYKWIYADKYIDFTKDISFGFKFGLDVRGCDMYAARAVVDNDLVPGYYIAQKREMVLSWESETYFVNDNMEILDISDDDADYKWVPSCDGSMPENAFPMGYSSDGNIIYTARTSYNCENLYGILYEGYFHEFLPFENYVTAVGDCEVLARIPRESTKMNQ